MYILRIVSPKVLKSRLIFQIFIYILRIVPQEKKFQSPPQPRSLCESKMPKSSDYPYILFSCVNNCVSVGWLSIEALFALLHTLTNRDSGTWSEIGTI